MVDYSLQNSDEVRSPLMIQLRLKKGREMSSYFNVEAQRRTVLVVVLNNAADFARARDEGWYRIPQRRAPRRIGADFLAFYQTGAFRGQPEAQTISFVAATRRYRLMQRRELLPDEVTHPRADEYYYRIDIGPLQRLERPVPATNFRRITFIHTTMARLLTATDVKDLFQSDSPFEQLWSALREHNLRPLKNRIVGERPIDITLRARGGYLGLSCDDERAMQESRPFSPGERWEFLHFSGMQITGDLQGCLQQIGAALLRLGGSMLHQVPEDIEYRKR